MNTYQYSVIIPVYNAEKTLRRCVDSLLEQCREDVQIILVNDGSSDSSGEICGEYARRNSCVLHIDKENGGVSSARNAGLDAAEGTYVLFVDSDDYVDRNYFSALSTMCGSREYDCVFFSFDFFGGAPASPVILPSFVSEDPAECAVRFSQALYRKYLNNPINKRFIREIIAEHGLRFPEEISIGEDKVFCLNYVMHCGSCLISPDILYHVSLENGESLSRKIRTDLPEQLARLNELTQQTISEARIPEEHRRQYQAAENLLHLRAVYSESKRLHLNGKDAAFRRKTIREMCETRNRKKRNLPAGIFSRLLQIPVRLKLVTVIDLFGKFLARR